MTQNYVRRLRISYENSYKSKKTGKKINDFYATEQFSRVYGKYNYKKK